MNEIKDCNHYSDDQVPLLINILIIDDDEDESLLFSEALSEMKIKHQVSHARTAEEGLLMLEKEIPDILFIDFSLPRMSGLEVLESIKKRNDGFTAKTFLYSILMPPQDRLRVAALGAGYLKKPGTFIELKSVLRPIMESILNK